MDIEDLKHTPTLTNPSPPHTPTPTHTCADLEPYLSNALVFSISGDVLNCFQLYKYVAVEVTVPIAHEHLYPSIKLSCFYSLWVLRKGIQRRQADPPMIKPQASVSRRPTLYIRTIHRRLAGISTKPAHKTTTAYQMGKLVITIYMYSTTYSWN